MFIGMVLVQTTLVKLCSTGYRFARATTPGERAYRDKGAPLLPFRLLAPLLVLATLGVFVTGVALLIVGHRSGSLLEVHKIASSSGGRASLCTSWPIYPRWCDRWDRHGCRR